MMQRFQSKPNVCAQQELRLGCLLKDKHDFGFFGAGWLSIVLQCCPTMCSGDWALSINRLSE